MKKLLFTVFAVAVVSASALAQDVTCDVNPSSGRLSESTWTSNSSGPAVKMALSSGGTIAVEGECYEIQTHGAARTLTFIPDHNSSSYYVKKVSMSVQGYIYNGAPDIATLQSGTTTLTTNADFQNFSVEYNPDQLAMITITPSVAGHNKRVDIKEIVVTLSSIEGDAIRTIEVNLTSGAYDNPGGWSHLWTSHSYIEPQITITASANNMGISDGIFDFRSGRSQTGTYTIAVNSRVWYISGFSFDAKMSGTDVTERKIQISGQDEVVLTAENQHFSAEVAKGGAAVFYVKGANTIVLVSNFKVTLTHISNDEELALLTADFNKAKAVIDLWHPILGDELYNEKQPDINNISIATPNDVADVNNAISAVEEKNAAWLSEANGRLIYLKNIRRPENNGKYLTANANNNHVNTKGSPVANSNWMIEVQGTTHTFKLFNPEKNKYLGKANHSADISLCNAGEAAIFELNDVTNQGNNNGTAFHIINHNDNNGDLVLNVDTGTRDLVAWNVEDGGSTWTIELAGTPASEIAAGKYYRIRSARTLAKTDKRAQGSLLGVNTALENGQAAGDVAIDPSRFSGLGTIWKVEASDVEGKYYLSNVAADFEGQAALNRMGKGAANANVTNNIGKFEFLTKDSEWNHKHPNAVIIKNQDDQYVDTNNGGDSMGTWSKCDNNWPNNGGIYFFEEATDYQEIKDAYIATANETIGAKLDMQRKINDCSAIPALWTAGDTEKAQEALDQYQEVEPATTVAQANSRRQTIVPLQEQIAAECADEFDEMYRAAENRPFIARNKARHPSNDANADFYLSFVENCSYSYGTDEDKQNVVGATLDKTSLAALWTLEYQGSGKYFIKNYFNNCYAGFNDSNNHPFHTSETDGTLYEILPYTINGETVIGFKAEGKGDYGFMHQSDNNSKDYIVRWESPVTSDPSAWYLATADSDENAVELKFSESTATRITFSIEGGTLSKHSSYGNHHAIVVTKQPAAEEPLSRTITEEPTSFLLSDDTQVKPLGDGTFAVDYNGIDNAGLGEGTYLVTVPTAAFKTSDDKVTRTASFVVTVGSNGEVETTGIEDVVSEKAKPARDVIFDLQGRRLSAPVKGINIINGKKVLIR